MTYEQLVKLIQSGDFARVYNVLTAHHKDTPIADLKKQWNAKTHDVNDTALRQDKHAKVDIKDEEGNNTGETRNMTVYANRVPIPFQKKIVNTAVSFIFGNPVSVTAPNAKEGAELSVVQYINKILKAVKTDSVNRQLARNLFRSTEILEVWHFSQKKESHERYGFPTTYDIRLSTFSNWDGSKFYPYYDNHGDMIAFAREYIVESDNPDEPTSAVTQNTYFEIYTKDFIYLWVRADLDPEWKEAQSPAPTLIGKMPIVYAMQDLAEWEDVQNAIERLETLLSNHADINDYNGSPILVAAGEILSMSQKGEAGKLLELKEGAELKYLSWDHAPESIKLEIENLFDTVYTFTQTPNFNADALKGITNISGVALRLLFMDAHLKVMDKRETFDPYLDRRNNVLKSILSYIKAADKSAIERVEIQNDIKPYMIEDLKELITTLMSANGGKAVASQKTTVALSGLTPDPGAEYEQIQAEEAEARENEAAILFQGAEPTV